MNSKHLRRSVLVIIALVASAVSPIAAQAQQGGPESGLGDAGANVGPNGKVVVYASSETVLVRYGRPAPVRIGSDGSRSVSVEPTPACGFVPWMTGPELAASSVPGKPAAAAAHATDTGGLWFRPQCAYRAGDGAPDGFEAFTAAFLAANPPRWSTTGTPPPPPIPVEQLIVTAQDIALGQIPDPQIATNPAGLTVVGLRTWVWPLAGPAGIVTATARSGPNRATVLATPGPIRLTASNGSTGPCTNPLVWSVGQPDEASDCYVQFTRSSARTGTASIAISRSWTVRLTTSDGQDRLLAADYPTGQNVAINVAEVQSVLR